MFSRRRTKEHRAPREDWTDKAAGKIAGAGIRLQTGFADAMHKMTSTLPVRRWKGILIVFCFISGAFSIYLAVHAIWGKENELPTIKVKPIGVPRYYNQTGSESSESANHIPDDLYQDIQAYKHYMDSLGQPIRAGLRDSIQILEQIYHSQKIK